jgi:hypothetical protein
MKSWKELENLHKGETGLIVGNGPSLNDVPLDFLRKYPSFGTNRIYLLDGFTPTYYAAVNPLVIEQSIEQIEQIDCSAKFIAEPFARLIGGSYILISGSIPGFSNEPYEWIYEGHTVTYVCMQLAYYMSFSTILLVGVDHRFDVNGAPNSEVVSDGPDINHFHPDYFGKGVRWHLPDLYRSELSYRMANTVYKKAGYRIVNLTPDTGTHIFEKGTIDEW